MLKSKRGFSLIEVMGAVLLFMVSIAAIMSVCVGSMNASHRAEYAYNAYNIAKNHIENLKAMAFSDLSSAAESATLVDANGVPDDTGIYSRTTTVTTSYASNANLTQLDVTVYYTFRGHQNPQPMKMTTVIYSGA